MKFLALFDDLSLEQWTVLRFDADGDVSEKWMSRGLRSHAITAAANLNGHRSYSHLFSYKALPASKADRLLGRS